MMLLFKKKVNLDASLIQYMKMNSKWTLDLNVKGKPIKLAEEKLENAIMTLR